MEDMITLRLHYKTNFWWEVDGWKADSWPVVCQWNWGQANLENNYESLAITKWALMSMCIQLKKRNALSKLNGCVWTDAVLSQSCFLIPHPPHDCATQCKRPNHPSHSWLQTGDDETQLTELLQGRQVWALKLRRSATQYVPKLLLQWLLSLCIKCNSSVSICLWHILRQFTKATKTAMEKNNRMKQQLPLKQPGCPRSSKRKKKNLTTKLKYIHTQITGKQKMYCYWHG